MRGPVPNLFPVTEPGAARLAIVGEAVRASDVTTGQPFTGDAGWVLDQALGHAGVARSQCFIGNVCQYRPGDNCDDFEALRWEGEEVQAGIHQLRMDLERFRPTMVLCLGDAALHLFKAGNVAPPRSGKAIRWPCPVGDWRGSLWTSNFLGGDGVSNAGDANSQLQVGGQETGATALSHPLQSGIEHPVPAVSTPVTKLTAPRPPLKCIATYHPADILTQWTWQAYLKVDLKRVVKEAGTAELVLPLRAVHEMSPALNWTVACVLKVLDDYRSARLPVSVDSEGTTTWVPCVGFASRVDVAHVVVFSYPDGSHAWRVDEEVAIWEAIARLLEDPAVPKVFQNYLHDAFVLAWTYGILVGGRVDDTMIQWWELNCELEKALAVQASVLTREPFWKSETYYQDRLAWVCGVDCCVTLECHQVMGGLMEEQSKRQIADSTQPLPPSVKGLGGVMYPLPRVRTSRDHYETYLRLLPPLLSMQLEGLPYDRKAARKELAETKAQIHQLQHKVNLAAWAGVTATVAVPGPEANTAGVAAVQLPGAKVGTELSVAADTTDNKPGDDREVRAAGEKRKGARAARSTPAERLTRFFEAVGGVTGGASDSAPGTGLSTRLIALTASCLCAARPRERQQVTEERWQPMRWEVPRKKDGTQTGDGKWVKDGKLTTTPPDPPWWDGPNPPGPTFRCNRWTKPAHRVVERSVEVPLVDWKVAERFVLESCRVEFRRVRQIARELEEWQQAEDDPSALLGELSTLLNLHLNVDSTAAGGDCQWLLYRHLTVPSRWVGGKWVAGKLGQPAGGGTWPAIKWEGRLGDALGWPCCYRQLPLQVNRETGRPTTNDTAILRIYQATQDERVLAVLRLRRLLTSTETLQVVPDPDGQMRCSYILPGTETARLACHTSATGSGYNLQTTTDGQRHLFKAPPGYVIAQADLRGSDAWTVAAHAAELGDDTYWDDLVAGLKPAKVITVMSSAAGIAYRNRTELVELCKGVSGDDWQYYANKRVGHGASYGMGDRTTADQILTDSFKETGTPVVVTEAYCRQVREGCFFKRYPGIAGNGSVTHPIPNWHERARERLIKVGALQHSSGFLRHFHGRKTEAKGGRLVANHSTWKEWLAHEPQVSTTWATLMALLRCWEDPANRHGVPCNHFVAANCDQCHEGIRYDGSLRATPIHTVHDSLLWLVRVEDVEWFRGVVGGWFDNPQEIAGRMVTIPYDLQVGADWGMA